MYTLDVDENDVQFIAALARMMLAIKKMNPTKQPLAIKWEKEMLDEFALMDFDLTEMSELLKSRVTKV